MALPQYGPKPPSLQDRIGNLQNRIQHKPGPNNNLRQRLSHFRALNYAQKQRNAPNQEPWDTAYETTVGNLNRDRAFAQDQALQQQQATNISYGIGDASNPYSRAALLENAYHTNQAKTGNDYAAQGQLYAGSNQNAQQYNQGQYYQGQDALLRDYQATQAGITDTEKKAEVDYQDQLANAGLQRIQDAINAPLDPTAAAGTPKGVKRYRHQLRGQIKHADNPQRVSHLRNLLHRLRTNG